MELLLAKVFIKPCTITESEFYERARAEHPEFADRILAPFWGQIQLSSPEQKEALTHQDPTSINAALQAQEGTAEQLVASRAETESPQADRQPFFGKKIDTDLHIVLENVTAGFVKPNTLDVKLGARLWDDDARPEKRQRLDKVSMETTSHDLGFRIAGMRVWQPEGHGKSPKSPGAYKNFDKVYGRTFTADTIRRGFEDFFFEGPSHKRKLSALRRGILTLCEAEVQEIEQQLEKLETRIYSASILFVYEGDNGALDCAFSAFEELQRKEDAAEEAVGTDAEGEEELEEEEEDMPKLHAVKLIDFAHAHWTPGEGRDENMLKGVRSVRRILGQMLKDHEKD
ncbi:MAG: hypothetical protein Q9159_002377 [Coniocarpon cinnabarinum]